MSELSQIKGINARQIKLLQESEVSTAEALAMSPVNVVAKICQGVNEFLIKFFFFLF